MTGTSERECEWCGLHDICDNDDDRIFACGTILAMRSGVWSQSTGCQEIMASRDRIRRALEALKNADRFRCEALEDGSVVRERSYMFGSEVDADIVDQVIQILEDKNDDKTE